MEFKNINDLVNFVKLNHKKGEYIYRGQTQPWQIQSSLFRLNNEKEREENWENTCHFCHWLVNNERLNIVEIDFDKALAICQHHGYKTDLVDFTWDIEVAAYFATHGSVIPNIFGVIWAIEWESFISLYEKLEFLAKPKLITVKGLWRIENQQGLFLRDENGFLINMIGSPDLYFRQTQVYTTEKIKTEFIYPIPNDLEREIDRYKSIELSRLNKKYFDEFLNNVVSLNLKSPIEKIEQILESTLWDNERKWMNLNIEDYKAKDRINPIRVQIKINSLGIIDISELIFNFSRDMIINIQLSIEESIEVNIEVFEFTIQEYVFTLCQLPYTNEQILTSTKYYISIIFSMIKYKLNPVSGNEIREHFKKYYNDDVIKFGFGDKSGISSYCMVPINYFEDKNKISKNIDIYNSTNDSSIKITKKIELFRQVTDIRKMMTEEEAIEFWIEISLPYQFAIRPKHSRIYFPHGITNFGYA